MPGEEAPIFDAVQKQVTVSSQLSLVPQLPLSGYRTKHGRRVTLREHVERQGTRFDQRPLGDSDRLLISLSV